MGLADVTTNIAWPSRRSETTRAVVVGSFAAAVLLLTLGACSMVGTDATLAKAADVVRQASSPFIHSVTLQGDWLEGDAIYVRLIKGAGHEEADLVWCEILLPLGLDETTTAVEAFSQTRVFDMPDRCDVPSEATHR
jgi:hypothetical protein